MWAYLVKDKRKQKISHWFRRIEGKMRGHTTLCGMYRTDAIVSINDGYKRRIDYDTFGHRSCLICMRRQLRRCPTCDRFQHIPGTPVGDDCTGHTGLTTMGIIG